MASNILGGFFLIPIILIFPFFTKILFKFLGFIFTHLVSILLYHPSLNLPLFLGKAIDGSFPLWSTILFAPLFKIFRAFSSIRRSRCRDAPYTEISQGLYVGGWPDSLEKLPPGDPAIVDCTCELPRNKWLHENSYLCIPTWDSRAPRIEQIEVAVAWACEKRTHNTPVFIHCAHGHGRSVTVMCAVLVALELADDWKIAEKMIKEKRPCIYLNALHRAALKEWTLKYDGIHSRCTSNKSPIAPTSS
ncbi:uncharacterized protein LOC127257748 [Andrographis paniculata]|uniref:uncharacterized protein LOC127257748 n=1 Tax=Andrographis paniculata TaxID=175694 RepID=UPI0021E988A9|nr:uncharacterized protein LOC127257748 [Andrographis paniculata]